MKLSPILTFCIFINFCTFVLCDNWVLLVAGSNHWYNYRHQADICHAYHVVRSHGIPDERIVVMMYDDIAHNKQNPFPGNIINHPNGPNVYLGVPKDYTGKDVRPDVFLKVLTGDADGVKSLLGREGKVIKSGPNDRVFVNFVDHGSPGLIAFPDEFLHAKEFYAAIKSMYKNKQYKQMVIYIEACESGSMFDGILPPDLNVFATTAANADESSKACYMDEKRGTFLGDVYSVMWMEDSDQENLKIETLQRQYEVVKKETNTSHVMEWGDKSLGGLKVADFLGNYSVNSLLFTPTHRQHPTADAVASEDVATEILKHKISNAEGEEKLQLETELQTLMKKKNDTDQFFKHVISLATAPHLFEFFLRTHVSFTDFTCYVESIRLIREMCPGMNLVQNDFALRKLRVIANVCETGISQEKIWAAIGKVSYDSTFCRV